MLQVIFQLFYEISTLLMVAAIMIHAVFQVIHRLRNRAEDERTMFSSLSAAVAVKHPPTIGNKLANLLLVLCDVGWLLIAIGLLILWPESLDPALYPRRSFLFFAAFVVFPAALVKNFSIDGKVSRILGNASTMLFTIGSIICFFFAFRYLVFVSPRMEGPDFYYYVSTARHMASGLGDISMIRYFYFPGVYTFWRIALFFGDGSLQSLQWWYFWVVTANALLISAVVHRVTRNIYSALAGLLWYIAFCSRFEGFAGAAEPIATIPVLIALWLWGGRSFMGRSGLWNVLALGTGLGLGLYVRQQAGLLSLGAVSLLLTCFIQDRKNPIVSFKHLLLLAGVSAVVLLAGILFEGSGLQPLVVGLENIPAYGSRANFLTVLSFVGRTAGALTVFSFIALSFWLACAFLKRFRSFVFKSWFQVVGFTCAAGFLSLIPFFSRAHLHYGLISGPMLIVASLITLTVLWRFIPQTYKQHPLIRFVVLILILGPFIRPSMNSPYFYLWPPEKPFRFPQPRPWRLTPGVSEDIHELKGNVNAGENIYVLPPRQNEIHLLLGTRHSTYGWGAPISLFEVVNQPALAGVIVVDDAVMPRYVVSGAVRMFEYERAEEVLTSHGFSPVKHLETMTLWRRTEKQE